MPSKVLMVDDDQEILELLRFTFEKEGYDILMASDGEEGLHLAVNEKPDIIVLDINMPKLTGFEVLEKVRANTSTCLTPVIILTSLTKTKDRITGIKLGADSYLSKPFEPYEIVARVEGLLKRTRESLAANPMTGMPGAPAIEAELKRRLESGESFTLIYADINNFKIYNDKYGFERGDNVIKFFSAIIRGTVAEYGDGSDFLGHIGGDDFVLVAKSETSDAVTKKIAENFDTLVRDQYDEDVRQRGFIWGTDKAGQEVKLPLMTISMGMAVVEPGKYKHYSQALERAKEMMKKAKHNPGSFAISG